METSFFPIEIQYDTPNERKKIELKVRDEYTFRHVRGLFIHTTKEISFLDGIMHHENKPLSMFDRVKDILKGTSDKIIIQLQKGAKLAVYQCLWCGNKSTFTRTCPLRCPECGYTVVEKLRTDLGCLYEHL